jgi:3,4-dihydroxy 2-butanone 4-phosphate synthase/GTP cyclohydrolase II
MSRSEVVTRRAEARIPTEFGDFTAVGFEANTDGTEHVALVRGSVSAADRVLVRVHSECLTGDVFGSLRCDCGPQLSAAMELVADEGTGVVLYSRGHEGRGIGLMRKLQAYALQDQGRDTVEANEELGFAADSRDYEVAAAILEALGVQSIRLLSNNPAKRAGLESRGVRVVELVPLSIVPTDHNRGYLTTKMTKLGHLLDISDGTLDI